MFRPQLLAICRVLPGDGNSWDRNMSEHELTTFCNKMLIVFFSSPNATTCPVVVFVVLPLGHGRSVADFWGWDAHEAQLRCADDVWVVIEGDVVPGGALNLNSTNLPRPWSPRESSPSHGRAGNRTRNLMISSQRLWPLDHEAGLFDQRKSINSVKYYDCIHHSISTTLQFLLYLYRARNKIAQLSIPTHAQLQRHRLKFIKNHLKISYMFRSSTIFRELQCPR